MKSDRELFTLRQSQRMNSSAITVAQSNAFVTIFDLSPIGKGPLDRLRFAVKDTIEVAGFKTGCGNPTWRRHRIVCRVGRRADRLPPLRAG